MRARRAIATAALAVLALCFCVLAGCGDDDKPAPDGSGTTRAGGHRVRVYGRVPDFLLTDQAGKPFHSDDLWGQVWIGNFFFTRCLATCPVQTRRMVELQAVFRGKPSLADVRMVSISVDPEKDTPAVLRDYAAKNKADLATWTFLTGVRRDIWALSTEGFMLPAGDDPTNEAMPIAHSALFILVDRVGRIRGFFDSQTDQGIAALERDLAVVAAEPARERFPWLPKIFDPPWLASRRDEQLEAAKSYGVLHDFAFVDQRRLSGIGFVNRVVDDAAKHYKAVHYDHGNGVAVADVDGDGLYDLYFSNQVGSNQLWRNTGDGKFEDITDDAGVAVEDAIGVTASFADIDNDGDPDLFVTTVRGGNHLFENDGEGEFTDITKAAGLEYAGHSSSAVFFDYNRDGLLDLFLTNVGTYTTDESAQVINDSTTAGLESGKFEYYVGVLDGFSGHLKPKRNEKSILYRNLGKKKFRNVNREVALNDVSWCGDATPIDANDDGWPDLYVLNMQGHDEYYENLGGDAFVRKSREVFPDTPWGSMGVKVFDFDNDGRLDLYLTDMHSDMSEQIGPEREKLKSIMKWPKSMVGDGTNSIWGNAFFRKTKSGSYEEISDKIGAENYWPWGLSVGDLNADGYEDVFIASSMNYPFRYGVNSVLLNDRGKKFLDSEFVLGVEPRRGRLAKPWFDLDCSKPENAEHRHCGDGDKANKVVWGALGSRSSVMLDLDSDGDLDIVTNEFNAEPLVLISDLAQRHTIRYLKVRLIGKTSNRSGVGAVVRVRSGENLYTKVADGQSGYLSQSDMPLYFGLGSATKVDEVIVSWPSGKTQTVREGIRVSGLLTISEE